jgi:hypothetical protein
MSGRAPGSAGVVPTSDLFENPRSDQLFARNAFRLRHFLNRLGFTRSQAHLNRRTAGENGLGNFFQLILEIGQVMGVPKLAIVDSRLSVRCRPRGAVTSP